MPVEQNLLIQFLRSSSIFRDLNDAQIELVIGALEVQSVEENQVIFAAGKPTDGLYMLYEGVVQFVQTNPKGGDKSFMSLARGDLFGLEMFVHDEPRLVTARAKNPSTLLFFKAAAIARLLRMLPVLASRFTLRAESYHLALHNPLSWREPNESVYFMARRHPFFLYLRFILPMFLTLIAIVVITAFAASPNTAPSTLFWITLLPLLFLVGFAIWEYIDWSNDFSIITSHRVLFQEKIVFLYDTRVEALIASIRSVDVKTDQVGLFVGYSDVVVHTFAGDVELDHIRYAKETAAFLDEMRKRSIIAQRGEQKAMFRQIARQRKGLLPPPPPPAPPPAQSGNAKKKARPNYLKGNRTNFFHMRFEEKGVVTYRTHIIRLISRVWYLLAILVGLLAMGVTALFTLPTVLTHQPTGNCIISMGVLLGFLATVWIWYRVEDWRNDIYVITDNQVIDRNKKPIGREELRTANFSNIEAVRFEQKGIIGLIFNYGTVFIRAGQAELTFDDVYNPSEIQRELFRRMAEREIKQKQEALRLDNERMMDYFEAYTEVEQEARDQQIGQDSNSG